MVLIERIGSMKKGKLYGVRITLLAKNGEPTLKVAQTVKDGHRYDYVLAHDQNGEPISRWIKLYDSAGLVSAVHAAIKGQMTTQARWIGKKAVVTRKRRDAARKAVATKNSRRAE
jgi:hypothetical protein